jgi:hypothetical protein
MAGEIQLEASALAELQDAVREYPVEFKGIADGWLAFRLVSERDLGPDEIREVGTQLAKAVANAGTPSLASIINNLRGVRLE